MVDNLSDEMADQDGAVDFVSMFGRQLPPRVLTLILGVPVSEAQQFRLWVDTLTGFDTEPEARHAAEETVHEYVTALIAKRRSEENRRSSPRSGSRTRRRRPAERRRALQPRDGRVARRGGRPP